MKKNFLIGVFLFVSGSSAVAQCGNGEVVLTVVANSYDIWGEECYWELVPAGNGCGNATILSGGSEEVGCAGNGPTGENGIPDFGSEQLSGCVSENDFVDLVWVDWYGDGGLSFDIYLNGFHSHSFWGEGGGNTWTIDPSEDIAMPDYDSACGAEQITPDGSMVTINTELCAAPFSELRPPGINCEIPGTWCDSGIARTGWAWFEAEENTAYRVSTCNNGTNFDTRIALFAGSECGSPWDFELLSANDDQMGGCGAGNGWASGCFISCVPAGTIVYIMVDGWGGQFGLAELSVETITPNENFNALVSNISCPTTDGGPPNGLIYPWITDAGINFSCSWTGPGGFNSDAQYLQGLGPGTYNLTLTAACGNTFTQSYTILNPAPWNVSVSTEPADCPGSGNGVIEVSAAGASGPYTYNIDGPGEFGSQSAEVTNAVYGNYTITVTDSQGCNYQVQAFVESDDSFTFSLGADEIVCLGDTLEFAAPEGLTGIWQDGSTGPNYVMHTADFGVGDAAIILSATTELGCSHTDVLVVTIDECVGVNEIANANAPVIYPNPAGESVWIRIPDSADRHEMRITDAMGRVVFTGTATSQIQLPLDAFNAGVYFIQIEGLQAVRLIKQ